VNKNPKRTGMSRREFAVTATMAAAAITLPVEAIAQQEKPPAPTPSPVKPPESTTPKLSEAAKREVEQKVQWIIDRYGAKLSDSHKADIRKYTASTQEGLEALRAFAIDNADEPATILHFNDGAPASKGARR